MKKIMTVGKKIGVSVLLFGLPLLALADQPSLSGGNNKGNVPATSVTSVGSLLGILCTFFGWAFYLIIVLAVVFGIVAAYRFLTSSGEQEKIREARNTILYAAIAVAVALLALAVPVVVGNFLGVKGLNACGQGASSQNGGGSFSPSSNPSNLNA
jgi:uncharacterized membrane protein